MNTARPTQTFAVVVHQNGDPVTSANGEVIPLPDQLRSNEVLIKMLAAPINPSDVLTIQGSYGTVPPKPFTVGFEGVGEIVEVGKEVTSLVVGDWVIPGAAAFGTWQTFAVTSAHKLVKIDKRLGVKAAATLTVNPCTAYLMLTNVVDLKAGVTIIQTGANSTVGLAVIQMACNLGIKTINVVRDRPNLQELVDKLHSLGADIVITDEALRLRAENDAWKKGLSKPILAIDCVSGELGSELVRHLAPGSTLLSYGSMSGKPLPVHPLQLIFRDIKVHGFWLTAVAKKNLSKLYHEVMPAVTKMIIDGKLQSPDFEMTNIKDFKEAIKKSMTSYTSKKQLLVMDECIE